MKAVVLLMALASMSAWAGEPLTPDQRSLLDNHCVADSTSLGEIKSCVTIDHEDKINSANAVIVSHEARLTVVETTGGVPGPQGEQGETGAQGPQGEVGPAGAAGPQGEQGVPGLIGATGPQGDQGIQGLPGADGVDGVDGAVGAQGPQGEQGLVGPQGPIGLTGAAGANGLDGAQGPMGLTGPQGIQGVQGAVGPEGPAGSVDQSVIDDLSGATIVDFNYEVAKDFVARRLAELREEIASGQTPFSTISSQYDSSQEWVDELNNEHFLVSPTGMPAYSQSRIDFDGVVGVVATGDIASGSLVMSIERPAFGSNGFPITEEFAFADTDQHAERVNLTFFWAVESTKALIRDAIIGVQDGAITAGQASADVSSAFNIINSLRTSYGPDEFDKGSPLGTPMIDQSAINELGVVGLFTVGDLQQGTLEVYVERPIYGTVSAASTIVIKMRHLRPDADSIFGFAW